MDKNVKIAKDLIRLARDLMDVNYSVSDNGESDYSLNDNIPDMADKEGAYKNFTGKIDYRGVKADVEDADFSLGQDIINFSKGTWKNGVWESGYFWNGTWEDGTWKDGTWVRGTWKNCKWEKGYDWAGNCHDRGDSPDKW